MEPIKIVILLSILTLGSLAICWLDYKKGSQLSDEKDLLIKQLTERVQVLEKGVTEPSYELNKKLNQL